MERNLIPQINEYMFNKKESIVVIPSFLTNEINQSQNFESQYEQVKMVSAMLCNLHELGYTIPRDELNKLWYLSPEALNTEVYQPLLQQAKEAKGAHVEHRILFPGFPDSVKALDIDTLSDIRFVSYFTTFIDVVRDIDALSDGSLNRTFVEQSVKNALDIAAKNANQESKAFVLDCFSDEAFYKTAPGVVEEVMASTYNKFTSTPRVIHLVGESEYFDMVRNMLSARTSLSEYDKGIVRFTIDHFDAKNYMPEKIQFRETQAMVDNYNFKNGHHQNINVRTITDFERLLVSLSDGDVALSKKQMIRNFSNQERKHLYDIFKNAITNNYPTMLESMLNRQSLRFAENVLKDRLHFNQMPQGEMYRSFIKQAKEKESIMAAYERNLKEQKYAIAANILAKHSPTLFVQHARDLLGKAYKKYQISEDKGSRQEINKILKNLENCAKKVDIKTLLSLEKEITKEQTPYRIMFPKGNKLDVLVKENKSVVFPASLIQPTTEIVQKGIKHQLENHEMSGKVQISDQTKVYIDPGMVHCPIPTVGRSDSGKNRSVAPGTKLPVQECDILRAALYKQNDMNQFIDFSAAFLDENYQMVQQVSWNNLKAGTFSYHSGDTSHCSGKGCTEIIDINLRKAKEAYPNAKYVVYMAVMWSGTPISSCNQLFMSLEPTKELGKQNGVKVTKQDNVYNPADVQFKVDIVGDARSNVPMIYDIENHQAMIVNIETGKKDISAVTANNERHFDLPKSCECIENYSTDIAMKCFAYANLNTPTIGDLAHLYAEYKNAIIVESPEEADVIFATNRIQIEDRRPREEGDELIEQVVITPFDKDVITAELIPDPKTIEQSIENQRSIKSQSLEIQERER